MIRLEDSRQQLTYILEDIRAIRSVALMADEEHDWNTEGDVVRLTADRSRHRASHGQAGRSDL